DPDSEPGHSIAPPHADDAEKENDQDLRQLQPGQQEVDDDHRADEPEQHQEQLALLDHVRLTGLIDQLGDLGHGPVYRQVLDMGIAHQSEQQSQHADHQTAKEN